MPTSIAGLARAARRTTMCVAAAGFALASAPAAGAAKPKGEPTPFGHACTAQDGVRFCPTVGLEERVPSFDGVPLDADVTLPASGSGPFPTIVMLHGWGGSKTAFEASTPAGDGNETFDYNNVYYAQHGFAVVNYSARGWGRSCGTSESRTEPGCKEGWIRLADQRYEARDTQHLLGLLADEGIAKPRATGVTGISYGGGQIDRARVPEEPHPASKRRIRAVDEPRWQADGDQGGVPPLAVVGPRRRARAERPLPGHRRRAARAELRTDRGRDPELCRRSLRRRHRQRLHRARRGRPGSRPDDVVRARERRRAGHTGRRRNRAPDLRLPRRATRSP